MVGAHHAHRAQRVICTHLMLTPTSSLPFLAVSLCMCRHGSAAVIPCGCDCTHWRCWWLPLPFHFFLLLLLSSSYTSPLLRHQVCVCVLVEREKGMRVSHSHTTGLLPTTAGWWLRGGGCVTFTGCPCGCSSSLPHAVLCCLLVPAWHVLLTPSHATTTTSVMASWPHCLSSPLSVTAHVTAAAAGDTRPDRHPHVMMMMTLAGVCHCVRHTRC